MQSALEPLFISIDDTAGITGESPWTVKEKLRQGVYRAKKSGRRTLILFESVKEHAVSLPAATFQPSRRKA